MDPTATTSQVTLIARVPSSICTSTSYVPHARAADMCACSLHPPQVSRDRNRHRLYNRKRRQPASIHGTRPLVRPHFVFHSTRRIQSSSFQFWTKLVHRVASSLNRSGWLVWRTLRGIAEALLISFFISGIVQDFLTTRIIVQKGASASSFSRCVQFWFFFCPSLYGFALRAFSQVFTILLAKCFPGLAVTCFLRQSALNNPHVSSLVDVC